MKLKLIDYEAIVLVLENELSFYRRYTNPAYNGTMGKRRALISDALWSQGPNFPLRYRDADIEDRDQLRRYFDDRYEIETDEVNKYAHIPSVWGPEPEPLPAMNPALKPFVEKVVDRYSYASWAGAHEKHRREALGRSAAELRYGCYTDQQFPQVAAAVEAAYGTQAKQPKQPIAAVMYNLETSHIDRIERIDQLLSEISTTLTQPEDITMNAPTILTVETRTFVNGEDVAKMSDSQVYDLIAAQEAAIEKLNEIKAKPKKLVDEIAKRQAGIAALVAHLDKAA
jgi:hypothetical protein